MALNVTNTATKVGASGQSTTLAYPGAVTAGSTLVCIGWLYNTGGTTAPAISDSVNGAWTVPANGFKALSIDASQQVFIAYKENTGAGTPTVTVNPSGSSADDINFAIAEITGVGATSFDVNPTPVNQNMSSGAASIASGVLSQADEVIFAVMAHAGTSGTTITPDATYTQLVEEELNTGGRQAGNAQYKIVASTASDTADWTVGTDGSFYNAVLASFKASAGGGNSSSVSPSPSASVSPSASLSPSSSASASRSPSASVSPSSSPSASVSPSSSVSPSQPELTIIGRTVLDYDI